MSGDRGRIKVQSLLVILLEPRPEGAVMMEAKGKEGVG